MLTWELLSLIHDMVFFILFWCDTKPLIVKYFIVNNSKADVIN